MYTFILVRVRAHTQLCLGEGVEGDYLLGVEVETEEKDIELVLYVPEPRPALQR